MVSHSTVSPSREITAEGGIQIGGGSEQVRIINNEIIGGKGNGITLGDLPFEIDGVSERRDPSLFTAASGFIVPSKDEERAIWGSSMDALYEIRGKDDG